MLPAPKRDRISLADVLPSCLDALSGAPNRLGLRGATRAVVVLADGLGASSLRARGGHARTLAAALNGASVLESGFPTTTATALATLATGVAPGQHGLVGYTVLDPEHDRVVNQLSGWDDRLDPATWQPVPTVFETAVATGFRAAAVGPERYRNSGFSGAILRGTDYLAAATIEERFSRAEEWMRSAGDPGILYLYVPELDMVAHAKGWESTEWTDRLETLDSSVRSFIGQLHRTDGVLLTADHGVLDVPVRSHVLIDADPSLVDGVRFVAGDPRCLQLHFEPDLDDIDRRELIERWREAESDRAWVATRNEAIDADWFGDVRPGVEFRIGDLLVAARKNVAYYDSRTASAQGLAMIGQHGSFSPAEVQVPLLRFGAFAR